MSNMFTKNTGFNGIYPYHPAVGTVSSVQLLFCTVRCTVIVLPQLFITQ